MKLIHAPLRRYGLFNPASSSAVIAVCLFVGLSLACAPQNATESQPDQPQPIAVEVSPDTSDSPPTEALIDALRNGRSVGDDLVTGGQPTPEVLAQAAASGYRTVIDLRTAGEDRGFDEAAEVEALGMNYVALPIDGAAALNATNAEALESALRTAETPILLHCGSGNRVGALLALKAFYVDGDDAQSAIEYGRSAGMTSLGEAVEKQLIPSSE